MRGGEGLLLLMPLMIPIWIVCCAVSAVATDSPKVPGSLALIVAIFQHQDGLLSSPGFVSLILVASGHAPLR